MSELILKTKTGAEFWTDTDDCTAEGNFNVFSLLTLTAGRELVFMTRRHG